MVIFSQIENCWQLLRWLRDKSKGLRRKSAAVEVSKSRDQVDIDSFDCPVLETLLLRSHVLLHPVRSLAHSSERRRRVQVW